MQTATATDVLVGISRGAWRSPGRLTSKAQAEAPPCSQNRKEKGHGRRRARSQDPEAAIASSRQPWQLLGSTRLLSKMFERLAVLAVKPYDAAGRVAAPAAMPRDRQDAEAFKKPHKLHIPSSSRPHKLSNLAVLTPKTHSTERRSGRALMLPTAALAALHGNEPMHLIRPLPEGENWFTRLRENLARDSTVELAWDSPSSSDSDSEGDSVTQENVRDAAIQKRRDCRPRPRGGGQFLEGHGNSVLENVLDHPEKAGGEEEEEEEEKTYEAEDSRDRGRNQARRPADHDLERPVRRTRAHNPNPDCRTSQRTPKKAKLRNRPSRSRLEADVRKAVSEGASLGALSRELQDLLAL